MLFVNNIPRSSKTAGYALKGDQADLSVRCHGRDAMLTGCQSRHVLQSFYESVQFAAPSADRHAPVLAYAKGRLGQTGDGNDIGQVTYFALPLAIIPDGYHTTVR